jgi:hypothetical protein
VRSPLLILANLSKCAPAILIVQRLPKEKRYVYLKNVFKEESCHQNPAKYCQELTIIH